MGAHCPLHTRSAPAPRGHRRRLSQAASAQAPGSSASTAPHGEPAPRSATPPPSLTLHSVAPVSPATTRCSALRPPAGPLPGGGSFSVPTDGEGGVKCRPVGLLPCSDSPERPPRSHNSDKNLRLAPACRVARPRLSSCHSSCPGPPLWPAVSSAGASPGSPAWCQPLPPAALCGPGLTDTASRGTALGFSWALSEERHEPLPGALHRGGVGGQVRPLSPSPIPCPSPTTAPGSEQSPVACGSSGPGQDTPAGSPSPCPSLAAAHSLGNPGKRWPCAQR